MLSAKGVKFQERDFFKDPFSEMELRELANYRSISELFSWKSPSFRTLGLDRDALSSDDLIGLMAREPRLIRRPFIRVNDKLIIGNNWEDIELALDGL